jgi:TRAP-type C4-dicarboxylate transport system substrate-binding protein
MNNIFKTIALILTVSFLSFNSATVLAKTIKIATFSPEGTYWMKQMRAGAEEVKKKTEGRVKFKFYPGGVMGNDDSVLRKMHVGQLHGGAITIGSLSQSTPDTSIYGLPFLFSSIDDAEEIRKTSDPMLNKKMEESGFICLGIAQGGFTYLMSKQKINSLEDLKNQKSWVPEKSDVGLSVYNYIGVTPISLPLSDVLTGLQTGLINTIITSPIGALALQWHTHVEYVVDLPLNYLAAMMVVDKKVFDSLSEDDQAIVREVMGKVYKRIDEQNKVDNIAARQALINQGVKFVKLSDKEKEEWDKLGVSVTNEMVQKYKYSKDLYKTVTANKPGAEKLAR